MDWFDARAKGLTLRDIEILDLVVQLDSRNRFSWMKKDHETIPKLIQLLGELDIDAPDLLKATIRETLPNIEDVCGELWEEKE